MQKDWLGNELVLGDRVLYSSKSIHTGMNLGELVILTPQKIQIKIPVAKWEKVGEKYTWVPGTQVVTLQKRTSAFRSVTKYFGPEVDLSSLL